MIIKCSECQEAMSESIKNRPPNLPSNIKWVTCKQCDRGIEVVGEAPKEDLGTVSSLEYTETVTITQYVTIKKTNNGVIKYKYADSQRTQLLGEEKLG